MVLSSSGKRRLQGASGTCRLAGTGIGDGAKVGEKAQRNFEGEAGMVHPTVGINFLGCPPSAAIMDSG